MRVKACVSNMGDVRAIRERMNHHWGGNDLGAPQRRVNYSITPELGTITHYLLLISGSDNTTSPCAALTVICYNPQITFYFAPFFFTIRKLKNQEQVGRFYFMRSC